MVCASTGPPRASRSKSRSERCGVCIRVLLLIPRAPQKLQPPAPATPPTSPPAKLAHASPSTNRLHHPQPPGGRLPRLLRELDTECRLEMFAYGFKVILAGVGNGRPNIGAALRVDQHAEFLFHAPCDLSKRTPSALRR